ncbi:MAG: lytic murein transglycosylase [Alphaproteobacteria bacterium]
MIKKYLALCLILWSVPAHAVDFDAWMRDFRQDATQAGISARALSALNGLAPDADVIELDQKQPEHKITFAEYLPKVMSADRIRRGKRLLAEHEARLDKIEERYGVPGKYIVALWGIESSFGVSPGNFSVLQSLSTLAYEGRRADFFRGELLDALRILDSEHVGPDVLSGSWAGAMGQCQFMPSTYLRYAVDGDGDGKRDIWNSLPDIFASMARYLQAEGWKAGQEWGMAVKPPRAVAPRLVGLTQAQPLTVWKKLGFKSIHGEILDADSATMYSLVQPDGPKGPSYLAGNNFKTLMRWNRSTYFATTVGLLADRIEP